MASGIASRCCYGPELNCPTFSVTTSTTCGVRSLLPLRTFLQYDRRKISIESPCFFERRADRRTSHLFIHTWQRSRASKGESTGSPKDEEERIVGGDGQTGGDRAGEEENGVREEIESKSTAEGRTSRVPEPTGDKAFWRNLWAKARQKEAEEVAEEEQVLNDEGNSADSDEDEGGVPDEIERQEVVTPPQEDIGDEELPKTGWRRFWRKRRTKISETGDVGPETSVEDELLLRDIENLQLKWKELLEPSVENVLALALTALLGLAGLQIVWQMVIVATAITLSALKYTVLAAIIVGLLVFLL